MYVSARLAGSGSQQRHRIQQEIGVAIHGVALRRSAGQQDLGNGAQN